MDQSNNIIQVEVVLQKINATNIFKFIDFANEQNFIIKHNGVDVKINGEDIMKILSTIGPGQQEQLFKIYNQQTLEEFKRTMARLYQRSPKQLASNFFNNLSNELSQSSETITEALRKANKAMQDREQKFKEKNEKIKRLENGGFFSKLLSMYQL